MNGADLAMYCKPLGVTKTNASTGAAATNVYLNAPVRKVWIVIMADAYHTAGAPRQAHWRWVDPVTPAGIALYADSALASGVGWYVSQGPTGLVSIAHPFVVTNSRYLGFRWTALGAGENAYINAVVLELPLGHGY